MSSYLQRYNQLVKRLLSSKGGEPLTDLSPELVAILQADGWWAPFENIGAFGDRPCTAFGNIGAGGAGIRTQFELLNPAASGQLIIVERIDFVAAAGANDLVIRKGLLVSPTGLPSPQLRDTRLAGAPSAGWFSDATHAVQGTILSVVNHLNPRLEGPIHVLSPGNALLFDPGADNVALEVSVWWREKQADPSELNLTG